MLCELAVGSDVTSLLFLWGVISAVTWVGTLGASGFIFWKYYANPTYETWTYKSNPKYPSAEIVRDEIIQMTKGVAVGITCPALSIWLATRGQSQAYCGVSRIRPSPGH